MKQAPERDGSEPLGRFVFTFVTKKSRKKVEKCVWRVASMCVLLLLVYENWEILELEAKRGS